MDGKVITFATSFKGTGDFLDPKTATGPFEVSASKNMVCVYRANLWSHAEIDDFVEAVKQAQQAMQGLREI